MIEELSVKLNGFYNVTMWPSLKPKDYLPPTYVRRQSRYVDRNFQVKYGRYMLAMAVVSAVTLLLPAVFYANQNYAIFYRLADLMNPALASYLTKERIGINVVFIAAFVGHLIFWSILCKKMTTNIAGPATILRNHMRQLARGNYRLEPIRLRESSEFKELVNTYNYHFTLLRVQATKELHLLQSIQSSISNPMALKIVNQLIEERLDRLGRELALPLKIISPAVAPGASHDSRHAS